MARRSAFPVLSALLLAGLPRLWGAELQAPKPSRAPEKGCVWKTLSAPAYGVAFLAEKCDFGFRTMDTLQRGAAFYEVLHDTDGAHPDGVWPYVTVYSKDEKESPEAAVKRIAFPALNEYQKEHCVVKPEKLPFPPGGRRAYSIFPDAVYQAKLDSAAASDDGVPEPPCGDMGFLPDNFGYFEFHPAESERRFVYVLFGQEDEPIFDEKSFRFEP